MVLHRRDFSFGVANELASNFAYIGGFILALNTCRERRAPAEGSRNLAAVPATGAGADRPG